MKTLVFKDNSGTLIIPDNSITYIYAHKRFSRKCIDYAHDKYVNVEHVDIKWKISTVDEVFEWGFTVDNEGDKIDEYQPYISFIKFLKDNFVKSKEKIV